MNERYFCNGPTTVLSAVVPDYLVTTIHVDNPANFPGVGDFTIKIDSELLLVTAVSGTTWTVSRGVESTQAMGHPAGAIVSMPVTADGVEHVLSVGHGGVVASTTRRLNFVDGGGVTWTVSDDPSDSRVNIAAAVSGGGGGGGSPYELTGTVPTLSQFTWVNQGSATAADSPAGIGLYDPDHNGMNMRWLLSNTPIPAVPWRVTCRLDGYADWTGDEYGLLIAEADNVKYESWGRYGSNLRGYRGTAGPTGSAPPAIDQTLQGFALSSTRWYRISQHDGKRWFDVSVDGYNWLSRQVYWDWLAPTNPTQAGFFANANNNWGAPMIVTCGYFKVESIT